MPRGLQWFDAPVGLRRGALGLVDLVEIILDDVVQPAQRDAEVTSEPGVDEGQPASKALRGCGCVLRVSDHFPQAQIRSHPLALVRAVWVVNLLWRNGFWHDVS